jgi:phosphoglycolate phosphatase-like HAD superfamily hydrolase
LIVFDMDGVITTEEKYWACARLTFWEFVVKTLGHVGALPHEARQEAIHSETARQGIVSDSLIYALKSRAVNSNWDITYVLACIYLAALPGAKAFSVRDVPILIETLQKQALAPAAWPDALDAFLAHTNLIGRELIDYAGGWVQHALGNTAPTLFEPEGAFWWYLHSRFQRFYHGEAMREYGGEPLIDGTAIPAEAIRVTLADLRARGVRLAAATGRPMDELNDALGELGLLDFFEADRMGTLDRVREGEAALNRIGLVKPHPYSLLRAIYPEKTPVELVDPALQARIHSDVVMVGDTTSDVIMAQAAGCRCIGVLTGVRSEAAKIERRQQLLDAGAMLVLNDITELPSLIGA